MGQIKRFSPPDTTLRKARRGAARRVIRNVSLENYLVVLRTRVTNGYRGDACSHDLPACPPLGAGELDSCSSRPEPTSVLRVRADCGGRLFAAKLGVVVQSTAR
jgi:hypothetical protein